MPKNPVIQTTKKYDSFKRFDSNREVNKNHLNRLVKSIQAKNLLYLFPIVVNIHREIIDGQHRLEAAKHLGVDVYYLIDGSVTKADIAMVNNTRKGWSAMDYILFYAKEGEKAYVDLRKLLKFYPLSIVSAARLMQKDCFAYTGGGGHTSVDLKFGNYIGGDYNTAKEVCEIAKAVSEHIPFIYKPYCLMEIKKGLLKNDLSDTRIIQRLKDGHRVICISEESDGLPSVIRQVITRETREIKTELPTIEKRPSRASDPDPDPADQTIEDTLKEIKKSQQKPYEFGG